MRFIFFILLSMAIFQVHGQNKWGFETMVNGLLKNSVDTITSNGLKELMDVQNAVVLDAREIEEYQVSHIPGAISVGYERFSLDHLPEIDRDKLVIVSCSLGKRSEDIGLKLKEAGFRNVKNHYGGIFDWTNRGFPVVNMNGEEVKCVHPFNSFWGIWVNNYTKAYEPR